MSNQDIEGKLPGDAEPGAPAGTPQYFEQQLAKEREARAQLRERLRNTEALAAESHALRARMAQELERVTAERDRLRSAVAAAPSTANAPAATAASPTAGTSPAAAPRAEPARAAPVAPPMTPRFGERPFKPPTPQRRKAPWLALGLLAGLAVGVAALAWVTGSVPGFGSVTTALAPTATPSDAASAQGIAAAVPTTLPAASVALASTAGAPVLPSTGAVALPPLTPEAQLAATPSAAGNTSTAQPAALPGRLRAALDGEGIVAPVDIDAATGRVAVSDPAADNASRDRTDTIIRAVYAGANLPEPQIEHRWLSPPRAGRAASAALSVPDAAAPVAVAPTSAHAPSVHVMPAHATPARAAEHARRAEAMDVAQAEPPILPAGRVTASCKAGAAGYSTAHRAGQMSACMKHSCCSSTNRQTEECRAYSRAYPFSCSAG